MVKAKSLDVWGIFQNTPGMTLKVENIILVPLAGQKVALNGSRHFGISKKHPLSKKIEKALEQGIKSMRVEGLITKAYKEAGFIHPKINHWQVIN